MESPGPLSLPSIANTRSVPTVLPCQHRAILCGLCGEWGGGGYFGGLVWEGTSFLIVCSSEALWPAGEQHL